MQEVGFSIWFKTAVPSQELMVYEQRGEVGKERWDGKVDCLVEDGTLHGYSFPSLFQLHQAYSTLH